MTAGKKVLLLASVAALAAAGYYYKGDQFAPLVERAFAAIGQGKQTGKTTANGDAATAQAASPAAPANASAPGAGGKSGKSGGPKRVITAVAASREMGLTRATIGSIISPNSINVTNDAAGLVTEIKVQDGATVKKGDVLLQLDPRVAQATVDKDMATVARDQATLDSVTQNLERIRQLTTTGAATQQALDDAQTAVKTASATLTLDKATLVADQVTLSNRTIRAPFDGRLGAVAVSPGSYIAAGGALVSLTQMSPLIATFNLPENDLGVLRETLQAGAADVQITPAVTTGQPHKARLNFIDSTVDTTSGTIKARAEIENGDAAFWPGQSVNVVVTLQKKTLVSIPTVAVQAAQNGNQVYVVQPDGKVAVKPVTIALTDGANAGISDGVAVGDHVIVEGQGNLAAGMAVQEFDPASRNKPATDKSGADTSAPAKAADNSAQKPTGAN